MLESFKNHTDDIYKGIYCNLSSFDNIITEDQIYFDKEFKKVINKGVDENIASNLPSGIGFLMEKELKK